jgi:hypothetical protein
MFWIRPVLFAFLIHLFYTGSSALAQYTYNPDLTASLSKPGHQSPATTRNWLAPQSALSTYAQLDNPIFTGNLTAGSALFKGSVTVNPSMTGNQINRLSDRLYVGGALKNQAGEGTTCTTGDWVSQLIPYSTCLAVLSVTSISNAPYAGVFATRTSDNPKFYAFASVALGINDSVSSVWPLETAYNETRAYHASSHTLAEESDLLNAAVPNAKVRMISPYAMAPGVPVIANKWLSNGRPDQLTLTLGGTATPGDTVGFTFSGARLSLQTISSTVVSGDTLSSIAARLAAAFNNNSALTSSGMYAAQIDQFISISNAPLPNVMTTTASVSPGGTESAAPGYGGNTSATIGIINNSTRQFGSDSGASYSGVVFDCLGLAGADCSDTGGFGEAIALGRKQSINFYNAGSVPGSPADRIYSNVTSSTTAGMNFRFNAGNAEFEYSGDGTVQASVVSRPGATDYVSIRGGKQGGGNEGGLAMVSSNPDANMAIATKGSGSLGLYGGSIDMHAPMKLQVVDFAALSALNCDSTTEGIVVGISDAITATFNAPITSGGGRNHVMAYCNGRGWTVH